MEKILSWIKGWDVFRPKRTRKLLWLGASLFFMGFFLKLSEEVAEQGNLEILDQEILRYISQFRKTAFNGAAVDFTALGSPTLITLFTVIGVILLWVNKDRKDSIYLGLGSSGAGICTYIMKHFFTRQRPTVVPKLVEVSGFSYPSGHSLSMTSLCLLLMFLSWRHYQSIQSRVWASICALFIIGGVCFSRLYLGVHYPSDVLSGVLVGAAWACFLTAYFSQVERSSFSEKA
jgi:undecaprenyl-diphosphatase